ncbi:hypothetical protein ABIB17_001244 [Arthrobacter sp. UYEF6]
MGKNLDHHHIGGALEAEPCILGDNLALRMLREDVEIVALGDGILREDGIVDSAT